MIDPTTSLAFSIFENKGVYALLLGSGISRAAHIPTGWEITIDLVRRIGRSAGFDEQADWAKWHFDKHGAEPSYSELLDALSQTPHERRSILHSYIEPSPEDAEKGLKLPTKAHRAIARLVRDGFIRVVVTTNFDRLLESALREVGVEPTVIASDDAIAGAIPIIHSSCTIIKVHGDYLDTRIRNTDEELSSYSTMADGLLDRVFDEHGLIICGWSADWDEALRNCLLRTPNRRYPLYWAARGTPGRFADGIIKHRAGRLITIADADSFLESLELKISTLGEIQRPDPRSIELLTASAKRYLAKPEYRIQLDELIGAELKILVSLASKIENKSATREEFAGVVLEYETISEPLARIAGICGRWGSDAEVSNLLPLVKSLAELEPRSGDTLFLALRQYPAVLMLYALGIGALKRGRYDLVFRLYSLSIMSGNDGPQQAAQELFLENWMTEQSDQVWAALPEFGTQRLRFALSAHLHTLFRRWTDDYFFDSKQYELLFEEFELLGTLATFAAEAKDISALDVMIADSSGERWIWAPVGRIAFHTARRNAILSRWGTPDIQSSIIAAGFSKKDVGFFNKSVACIGKIVARSQRW
jgi:hypothetical protein